MDENQNGNNGTEHGALFYALKLRAEVREEIGRLHGRIDGINLVLGQHERQVAAAFETAEDTRKTATAAQQEVNKTQNEFRGALKDQALLLATKEDVERLVERVSVVEKNSASGTGRTSGLTSAQTLIFAIVSMLISIVSLSLIFWKK